MQSQVTQGGWGHPGHTNHYPFSNSDPIRSFHQAGNRCSRGSQHNCPFGHQFYQHNTTAGGDASGCRHGSCQLWRNCYLNPNHHPYQPREQPNNYGHPTGHANTQARHWHEGQTGLTRRGGYAGVTHVNNNTTLYYIALPTRGSCNTHYAHTYGHCAVPSQQFLPHWSGTK